MAKPPFLDVLDVARALGPEPLSASPRQVANFLVEDYAKKRGGGFNYNPSIDALYDLFQGVATVDSAVLHCLTNGIPKGRRQNAEVIKLVAPYALQNQSRCYRIGNTAVVVGRIQGQSVYIGIKSPMVRVAHGKAFVVMPGFRKGYRPSEPEIDTACSIALSNLARDDFADADFEYLYAGPGHVLEREFRFIHGRTRKVYERNTVDQLLHTYIEGVALAMDEDAMFKGARLSGYKIIDPSQPGLFD